MFFSLMFCYLPAILLGYKSRNPTSILVFALLGLGTAAFPAVLLTMSTSRSIFNLRPDRLIGVAATCGVDYVFAVLAGGLALTSYLLSFSFMMGVFISVAQQVGFHAGAIGGSFPLLLLSLFMMHGFCWYLGTLYVRHHEKFPWPFLQHQKQRQTPVRRKVSYVKKG